jgi:hypothetical protein
MKTSGGLVTLRWLTHLYPELPVTSGQIGIRTSCTAEVRDVCSGLILMQGMS